MPARARLVAWRWGESSQHNVVPHSIVHTHDRCKSLKDWFAALDDFRNWVTLGFQPAKRNENPWQPHNGGGVER
jgi:hypothetical protein